MKPETILQEKAEKYYCIFDEIQTKAILEAMRSFSMRLFTSPYKIGESKNKAEFIIKEIGEYLETKPEYFKIKSRKIEYIKARQIAIYFIRNYTKLSTPKIGEMFGGKDHTTVLSALKKVSNYMDTDKKYEEEIIKLKLMFDEKL